MDFLKRIFAFFDRFSDSFLFVGLIYYPIFSLFRALSSHLDPNFRSVISFLFLIANCIIIFLVFFSKDFHKNLISIFLRVFNTTIAQHLLFFCIWLEQLLLTHPLITFFFTATISVLYAIALLDYFFLWFFLQLFLILAVVYIRLRRTLLNAPSFEAAGLVQGVQRPYTWATVLLGLNSVIAQKFQRTEGVAVGESLAGNTIVRNSGASWNFSLIKNRLGPSNNPTFPFLPQTLRRNMSTRAAIRQLGARLFDSFEKAPVATGTTLLGGLGTAVGGGYLAYKDHRDYKLKERELRLREQDLSLREQDLSLREQDLSLRERTHKDTMELEYAKLNAAATANERASPLGLLNKTTSSPGDLAPRGYTLNPADGGLVPRPAVVSSSETANLISSKLAGEACGQGSPDSRSLAILKKVFNWISDIF